MTAPHPLSVVSVTVFTDRLEALVHVDGPLRTSAYPGLAERALAAVPSLAGHACDNPSAASLAEELADTELPHLAEHLALDLMRRAGVRGRLRGDTSWDFERDGAGTFRVQLDCVDDTLALGAMKWAVGAVNALAAGEPVADPQAEATSLREGRRRSRPEPKPRPRRA
jgi:hypothetical protein